jgi:hypothetical protein
MAISARAGGAWCLVRLLGRLSMLPRLVRLLLTLWRSEGSVVLSLLLSWLLLILLSMVLGESFAGSVAELAVDRWLRKVMVNGAGVFMVILGYFLCIYYEKTLCLRFYEWFALATIVSR